MALTNLAYVDGLTEAELAAASIPVPKSDFPSAGRRLSIDAMRGYCLWHAFLIGPLLRAFAQLPPSRVGGLVVQQYTHAKWNGFHYIDAGYPTFIVLLATSMVLSHQRHQQEGMSDRRFFFRIARRSVLLWLFAIFFYGGFSKSLAGMPFDQVFFQLAGCIFLTGAAIAILTFRMQLAALLVLLIAQWAVMTFVYVPEYGHASFSKEGNVQRYTIDSIRQYFEHTIWPAGEDDYVRRHLITFCFDVPEMFGSCLLGLILGHVLLSKRSCQQQVLLVGGLGALAMAAGWIWNGWLPINKHLWTSSFTLFSGGIGYLHVAAFMQIVEVWKQRWFAFPFLAFGRHSLAAWTCFFLVPFDNFALRLFGPGFPPIFGIYRPLVLAFTQVMLCWLLFLYLDRHVLRRSRVRPNGTAMSEGA